MTEKEIKIGKQAYQNGFRAGYSKGQQEGYKIAHDNITRHLSSIIKWRPAFKSKMPPKAFCWNCLASVKTGVFKIPIRKKTH